MNDSPIRAWFCVWNNPIDTLGDSVANEPQAIAEYVLYSFCGDNPSRSGAVAYCISADGLHHLHMVLCDAHKMRFSAIKSLFPKAHLEPMRGSKKQAQDYINKVGVFEEKGEQVLYVAEKGEISSNQGSRIDLQAVQSYIDSGMTPNEIFDINIAYRRYANMIKDAYYAKRIKDTPFIRDVKVYWHFGDSGSGKSFTAKQLIDKVGEDNVYFLSDYDGGGFDNYNGQQILFLDEFKGQLRFSSLLSILDCYKQQVHSRYSNAWTLWNEVHITSVFAPDEIYKKMVASSDAKTDTLKQLLRRITDIVFHYKENGEYKQESIPAKEYTDRSCLGGNRFVTVDDYEQVYLPFD